MTEKKRATLEDRPILVEFTYGQKEMLPDGDRERDTRPIRKPRGP